jgi:hypothetical protein
VEVSKDDNRVGTWDIESDKKTFTGLLPERISNVASHQNCILIGVDDNRNRGHMNEIVLLAIKDKELIKAKIDVAGKEIHHGCCHFALNLDKRLLALSSYSDIYVWNLSSKILLGKFKHDNHVNDIAFNEQGTFLASASDDWSTGLWLLDNKSQNKGVFLRVEDSRHIVQKVVSYPQENILCSCQRELFFCDISEARPSQICAVSGFGDGNIIMSAKGQFFGSEYSGLVWCFPMPGQFAFMQLWWLKAASLAQKRLIGPVLAICLYNDIDRIFGENIEPIKDHLTKIMQKIILEMKIKTNNKRGVAHRSHPTSFCAQPKAK